LGTGDEKPRPTPVRIDFRPNVVAVVAAENHSLCVTAAGHVYAFGSNRFGQLGISPAGSGVDSNDNAARCSPRRVDDLKHVFCTSVAAGAKHSVALSKDGEVFTFGDNSAGQLGVSSRSSNSIHKVQRVDALWKGAGHGSKKAIAIAASERSTLALTSGGHSFPVNAIYAWGHGSHVPSRVQFPNTSRTGIRGNQVNPVAIASARYHHVTITSDGEVYTWGLHADSLGTREDRKQKKLSATASLSLPQLVTGMLPENGGGKAVAVSSSENHTAVVTDEGHLYTFGDTYSENILGHEGVRWQPDPKRVPGVHRAIAVSAAKEHTVLLIGSSFPPLPRKSDSLPSLETLAARTIAKNVDLFNAIPILIIAERTQTCDLLQYCYDFIKHNMEGILNVGQRSVLDCYLNEQLLGSQLTSCDDDDRDKRLHPLIRQVIFAGNVEKPTFGKDRLSRVDNWVDACERLGQDSLTRSTITLLKERDSCVDGSRVFDFEKRSRSLSLSANSLGIDGSRARASSICSERCKQLTANMNLSTKVLAEAKLTSLSKEVRAVRKRLLHIEKLQSSNTEGSLFTPEQQQKLSRKILLEADLSRFEPAIEAAELRIKSFRRIEVELEADKDGICVNKDEEEPHENIAEKAESVSAPFHLRCDVCKITCPDKTSYELHVNGRKHRNRLTQVADEEKRHTAAQMVQEQQKLLLISRPNCFVEASNEIAKKSNPWSKKDSVQPIFKLPPPPHPVVSLVDNPKISGPDTKMSLRDIMAEESAKKSVKMTSKKIPFALPAGYVLPEMKSPPWEAAKNEASSSWKTPTKILHTASASRGDVRQRYSATEAAASPRQHGWSTPTSNVKVHLIKGSSCFQDIQQQELEFKLKQDRTFRSDGKWFIEQRERAESIHEIQSAAVKQEEERRLVEEQIEIEKQIYAEIAARKAQEERKTKQHARKPKPKPRSKSLGKATEGNEMPSQSSNNRISSIAAQGSPRKCNEQKQKLNNYKPSTSRRNESKAGPF
jgi:alpha-tubulin suppressor-like RCC1 family protein